MMRLLVRAVVAGTVALGGCVAAPEGDPRQSSVPATPAIPPPARVAPDRAEIILDGAATQGGVVLGIAPPGTRTLTLAGSAVPVASDGRFILGFDRDAGTTAALVATLADGRTVTRTIEVAPRAWRIERLDTLPRVSQPSAEFARRRTAELAQIAAARRQDHAVDGWRRRFGWPAFGRISGLFGAQRVYKGEPGSYHSGIDIALPTGAPVVAPEEGVVILAADAPFTLEGNLLMIDHGMGLNSAFLHLSRIDVAVGDRVQRGQAIGAVGATGRATGPHLHWGLMLRGARIDPLLVAEAMID
jgi:murein DD-endopeptidase MepM/ murein hydrolase activator NlpD